MIPIRWPQSLRTRRPRLPAPAASRAGVRRQALSEQGAALVELALCMPMMMVIFVGIVDYALLLEEQMTISQAAAAGVAFGAIYGNQANLAGMQTAAANAAVGVSGFSATASEVYTCTPGGAAVSSTALCSGYGTPIKYVTVVTTGNSPSLAGGGFLGLGANVTLQSTAYFRVRWTP